MTPEQQQQLAAIRERIGTRSGPTPSTLHQEPTFSEAEVRLLLDLLADAIERGEFRGKGGGDAN